MRMTFGRRRRSRGRSLSEFSSLDWSRVSKSEPEVSSDREMIEERIAYRSVSWNAIPERGKRAPK